MVKKNYDDRAYVKPFSSDTGTLRTDGRTDGQRDRFATSISRVSMLTREKKSVVYFQLCSHENTSSKLRQCLCGLNVERRVVRSIKAPSGECL